MQLFTCEPSVFAESMRSPLMVTPAGTRTGPPPSATGHVLLGQDGVVGSAFISSIAHVFFVKLVMIVPLGVLGSWPRCVSEALNHASVELAAPALTPDCAANAAMAARCATKAGGGAAMRSGAKKAPSTGRARSAAAAGGNVPVHSGWSVRGKRDDVVFAKKYSCARIFSENADGAGGALAVPFVYAFAAV